MANIDYSKIPTSDLQSLQKGDLGKVSTTTLQYLKNHSVDNHPIIQGAEPPTPEWAGEYPNLYGLYGAGRELYRTVGKPAIEGLGMAGGAVIGSQGGVNPVGGIAGAGLGYGAARNMTGYLDQLLELDRLGEKPLSDHFRQTIKDVLLGGAFEGGGQVIGKAVEAGARKVLAPHLSKMTPDNIAIADKAKSLGMELSPAEITKSKNLALFESMMEKTPFSSDIVSEFRELKQLQPLIKLREEALSSGNLVDATRLGGQIKKQTDKLLSVFKFAKEDQLNAMRNNVLRNMGSTESFDDLGMAARDLLEKRSAEAVSKKNDLYKNIWESIPDEKVAIDNLQSTAQKHLAEISRLPDQDPSLMKTLKWSSQKYLPEEERIMSDIAGMPEQARQQVLDQLGITGQQIKDPKTLQNLRVQLNDKIRQEDLSIKSGNPKLKGQLSNEGRIYKDLRQALDKDLEAMAEKTGTGAVDNLKAANAFYAEEYSPVWKQKTIQRMAYSDPEKILDVVFKKNAATEVNLAKKALGDEGFNETIKNMATQRLLGIGKTDLFNPQQLSSNIENIGDITLSSIYSPSEIKALKSLATRGKLLLDKELPGGNFLKATAQNYPDVIVDSILGTQQRLSNVNIIAKNIHTIKQAVDKDVFKAIQTSFIERLFSVNPLTGQVRPESFAKMVESQKKVLPLMGDTKQTKWLQDIADVTKRMASAERMAGNPSGTAQNVITWGTLGMVIRNPIKGTFMALTPEAMAKIYFSETGRRYFTTGLTVPANTKMGTELFTKLSAVIGEDISEESQINSGNKQVAQ